MIYWSEGGEARPNGLDELLARARRGRAAWGMLRAAAAAQHRGPAETSHPLFVRPASGPVRILYKP